jgi:hypothetical protein
MSGKNLKYILITLSIVLVGWFIYDTFTLPGPQDLNGNFKEVTFYRNENNTGPIIRIYAVTTSDTLWQQMESYGNFMPHTKYGNTKVFFFSDNNPTPAKISPEGMIVPAQYQQDVLAVYEKDAMGQVSLIKYPFSSVPR